MKTKALLRKEALDRRSRMHQAERKKASALIAQRLFSMREWREAKRVFLYYGCKGEAETEEIIKSALSGGKLVFLPKVISSDSIVFIRVTSIADDITAGAYGIPEPEDRGIYEEDMPDLILVPCVAVDERGHRIGHGKGYYDRYLEGNKDSLKICPAYECQIAEPFEPDHNDVSMDVIITEERILVR